MNFICTFTRGCFFFVFFCCLFRFFFFFFNKMAAASLWDSKHYFSSGTCRTLATVWGRFHGECHRCNGHQRWLAGKVEKGIDEGRLGLKRELATERVLFFFFFFSRIVNQRCSEWLLTAARRKKTPDIWQNLRQVLKVNASEQNTHLIRLPHLSAVKLLVQGLYFSRVVWRQEMQTKD